uniref:Photosystem I assembly protein Ycf4 n=1 Tax=Chloroparvula japonica TaxID=1411623 RepID=A0A4D6C5L0_9CHLO|nr:hypothetical chloroplast RF4 [Chloroparvula japonica]QBX98163.1 hypothetical chloroplast RF4 [Chloroparvula japonica]
MDSQILDPTVRVRRDRVVGSRSIENYWWASVLSIGSLGFLVAGLSSFFGFNILPFLHTEGITFLPQGLVMSFYGSLGIITAGYLWLTMLWKVGDGYNEFNKIDGTLHLFRWGFPGKGRRVDVTFPLQEVEGVLIRRSAGLGEQQMLCIRLRGRREVPLINLNSLESQNKIEGWAADLARFLNVPLVMQ